MPLERFRAAVEANAFLTGSAGVSIDTYRSGGGLAVTQEGWIESSAGVAEAEFYLSKVGGAWCLTGVVIGGTPALPAPGDAAVATAPLPPPPKALQNDAYRTFGLGNAATRRYVISRDGGTPAPGTQRVERIPPEGDGSAARFRIARGGALGVLGSLEVALDADGIWFERSSEGAVRERALMMPAKLAPAVRWRTVYVLDSGAAETRYQGDDEVLAPATVTTPAGTFSTIPVISHATVESGDQRARIVTRAWYAEGLGSVRVESETTPEGGTPSTIVVELVDAGTPRKATATRPGS